MTLPVPELESRHRPVLDQAMEAIRERSFFSAYPESPSPKVYGDEAAAKGKAAFEAMLGKDFPIETPGAEGAVATEKSPFGFPLEVRYPRLSADGVDTLIRAARAGIPAWRDAGPTVRTLVCMEILAGLHSRIFELGNAVQHTSGQAFVMAFQAGGAHALDRALESLAYAYAEMTRHPQTTIWEKPGRGDPLRMEKTFTAVPRGVGVVIGCNTFPTWNSYPGLFASLVTGNPVVVKPHPGAVLPLAITAQVAREVLSEHGFDPNLVTLAAEDPADGMAKVLATRPEVRLVDFTGSNAFGDWLEQNATQAVVFTEKAGVNTVVVDSTDSFKGMCSNLAFSLSLYSGQMCTAPQNVYVPADGIETDEGHKSFEEVGTGIAAGLDKLLGEDARAVELLGGIANDGVLQRLGSLPSSAEVVVESRTVKHPSFEDAVVRTPTVLALDSTQTEVFERECFGPVSYLIRTPGTAASLDLFRDTVTANGAMTASVYSTSDEVIADARSAALDAGVALSENLTGQVFVNQSAAFSDFHGTGANPSANASFTDAAFVANRFRVVQSRRHL
ncbi:MAG: phenylacetic acid degradation protein PaaN [Nocardioidaceae bacterium]